MIIPFYELKKYPFCITEADAFVQTPSYTYLIISNRKFNGFICIKSGKCRYMCKNGSFTMSEGAIAYVPSGSVHELEILSDSIEFYRVDFTVTINGEKVFFSENPIKLTDSASAECLSAISRLASPFARSENSIEKTENICTIFRTLQQPQDNSAIKKLAPALDYIANHFDSPVSCKQLARLCYLGTSQFYELFKKETSKSPLEYRDSLLIREARLLIENTERSVNEISAQLGFQSPSYFSRFFKKHVGCSPLQYKKTAGVNTLPLK
ncbi:MAG: helix-turn-helix transcriptional regulator [Clostridia bacterium]|nr:helix-turn-helix transcriptional regulator [Clostridia bacterium]